MKHSFLAGWFLVSQRALLLLWKSAGMYSLWCYRGVPGFHGLAHLWFCSSSHCEVRVLTPGWRGCQGPGAVPACGEWQGEARDRQVSHLPFQVTPDLHRAPGCKHIPDSRCWFFIAGLPHLSGKLLVWAFVLVEATCFSSSREFSSVS